MKKPQGQISPPLVAVPDKPLDRPAAVEKSAPRKAKKERAVKRSFTLHPDQVDYMEKLALKLGQKRGKSMTSSEALRVIISDHMKGGAA